MPDAGRFFATLPYWTVRRGWRVVVKLGGSAMEETASLTALLQDMAWLNLAGQRVVLVHGGGKPIDRALAAAGVPTHKVNGRRVTDEATLGVVVRVLGGEISPSIARQLTVLGAKANCHDRLLVGSLLSPEAELGRVGRVDRVDTEKLDAETAGGIIPVLPSLALDEAGAWLNVNADDAAAAVAVQWRADLLVFLTDTPGLLREVNDPSSRIDRLTPADAERLTATGVIAGGMVPKVQGCLDALARGVGRVQILDGRVPHALVYESVHGHCPGTEFSK